VVLNEGHIIVIIIIIIIIITAYCPLTKLKTADISTSVTNDSHKTL